MPLDRIAINKFRTLHLTINFGSLKLFGVGSVFDST